MGSTLTNGIYLPAEGERNCYTGLAANWSALDSLIGGYNAHIGNTTIHVTAAEKEAWNGKADASALNAHTGDATIHVTAAEKEAWNGKADNSALTAHTGDTTIHVTSEDKQAWNGKADASALTAHTGDTTIHVTAEDKQAWNGKADASALTAHTGDTTIHVTAADKAKWDAVTSKADDSDVVHKSGNETIPGNKTFSSINGVEPSSLSLPSDRSARVDISSYFTNTGTGQSNSYTVPANGYIYLTLSELTNIHCFSRSSGNVTNYAQTFTKLSNSTGVLYVLFPVRKNDVFVATWYTTTTVSVDGAFFIPCQGNV